MSQKCLTNRKTASHTVLRAVRVQRAFTLIELLVVIAIIALLAAILFPVFARARENARRSSCQSNMKQLGLGIIQYAQDYDERLPVGCVNYSSYPNEWWWGGGWGTKVFPYVKSVQIYKCPSDSTLPYGISRTVNGTIYPSVTVSYAYNSAIPHPTLGANASLAKFNAIAKTVMLCEVTQSSGQVQTPDALETSVISPGTNGLPGVISGADYGGGGGRSRGWFATGFMAGRGGSLAADPGLTTGTLADEGKFQYPYGRHLEGSNFLMADGHVKWYRGDKVSTGYAASDPNAAQDATANAAEGTGNGAHEVTFSPT